MPRRVTAPCRPCRGGNWDHVRGLSCVFLLLIFVDLLAVRGVVARWPADFADFVVFVVFAVFIRCRAKPPGLHELRQPLARFPAFGGTSERGFVLGFGRGFFTGHWAAAASRRQLRRAARPVVTAVASNIATMSHSNAPL